MLVGKQQSIRYYAKSWLPARTIVAESIASRKEGDETGEIMVLKQFCPVSIFFQAKQCDVMQLLPAKY
jgi:hypothetical protein